MPISCLHLTALTALLLGLPALAVEKLQFNRDIRPILSDKCFFCHGTDANHRKGDLRLDEQASAFKPAKSGEIAIVPGKPGQSALLTRIELPEDDDDAMPPKKSGKALNSKEKALLKQWISQGAEYQGHWAFTPPKDEGSNLQDEQGRPLRGTAVIDHYIRQRLQREGLSMAPEAPPEILIRRVTLDLTGLPPSSAEVEAFVADYHQHPTPAYERLVDRLLLSPHYGERMAMQWLDYARYADSHGFQTDSSRSQWPWRDWVIHAFNDNKPFDQFTLEQLAGDLLPQATRDQVVATGFNRNHRLNGEGGIIAEEWRIENVIDRTETLGLTWLALTLNCCRCHDHKFDPITQKDFYSLFAFFNNLPESGTIMGASNRAGGNSAPLITVPSAEQEQQLARLQKAVDAAQAKVSDLQLQLPNLLPEWEEEFRKSDNAKPDMWALLDIKKAESLGKATLRKLDDGSWLTSDTNPASDTYVITASLSADSLSGLLLEALPDPSLPNQSLGRANNGNFVLTAFEAELSTPGVRKPQKLKFTRAEADYAQKGYDIKLLLDADPKNGWAIDGNDPAKRVERKAMFVLDKAIRVPAKSLLTLRLKHESHFANHNIGRFRLSATTAETTLVSLDGNGGPPAAIATILDIPSDKRTEAQRQELTKFFRTGVDTPLRDADYALTAARKAYEDFDKTLPSVMVMKEEPKPRDAFVLSRGEYDKPKDKVIAALPAALSPPQKDNLNRLDLAKWIVSPENPLTARVWVNRQWEKFFGIGLVKTVENFGMQAEYPSHPELLDWLATEFIRLKWDMKAMQKRLLMSAAYRQSSRLEPGAPGLEKDPENRLLWHGPRVRLTGEMVRDQALALSGLLVDKIGGPSVRPYMPEGVWDETSKYGDLRGYKPDAGDGLYRRTMYTIWKRTAAPPTMLLFDAPTREICTIKRSRTNTPLQALAMLNEITFVEAARALAEKMMLEGGATAEQRIAWAFQRVTSRAPSAEELQVLSKGLSKRLAHFKTTPEDARQLIDFGTHRSDAKLKADELAAYAMTANVLLNLDEVVTRQ